MFDIIMPSLFLAIILFKFRKNKTLIKELTKAQLTGVLFSYLTTIFIGFVGVYYIGNHLTGYIHNAIIKFLAEIFIILVVLYFCSILLRKLLNRITIQLDS